MSYKEIVQKLRRKVGKVHLTKKEFALICEANKTNEWKEVHVTKIYQKYGGEYCELLYLMSCK